MSSKKERKNQDNINREVVEMINIHKDTREFLIEEGNIGEELILQYYTTIIDIKKRLEQFCNNPDSDQGLVRIVRDHLEAMTKVKNKITLNIEF
jgi:hypothetical protein